MWGVRMWLLESRFRHTRGRQDTAHNAPRLWRGLCHSPEEGWPPAVHDTLGETCILLLGQQSRPHCTAWCPATMHWHVTAQAPLALEPTRGTVGVNHTECSGATDHSQVGGRYLGASKEGLKITFPKSIKEQSHLTGAATGQVFQTRGLPVTGNARTLVNCPPTRSYRLPAIQQGLEGWEGTLTKAQEEEWPHLQPMG